MFELIGYIILFVLSFYVITKAADYFIDESATIGKRFGMSKLMIGLTIVSIGTSLPEMITSLGSIMFYGQFMPILLLELLWEVILLIFYLHLVFF